MSGNNRLSGQLRTIAYRAFVNLSICPSGIIFMFENIDVHHSLKAGKQVPRI